MNERILELAEQAKAESSQWLGSKPATTITYDELEKFAELIVRECIEQSMSIGRYNTPGGVTPDLSIAIAVGLKKHFGVEE